VRQQNAEDWSFAVVDAQRGSDGADQLSRRLDPSPRQAKGLAELGMFEPDDCDGGTSRRLAGCPSTQISNRTRYSSPVRIMPALPAVARKTGRQLN
jgi:hypothetical protein